MVSEQIQIEVVYALPMNQTALTLKVSIGTSVEEAIRESGILAQQQTANQSKKHFSYHGLNSQFQFETQFSDQQPLPIKAETLS